MNPVLLYYRYKWVLPESVRRWIRGLRSSNRQASLASQIRESLFATLAGKVSSGPFAGMRYIKEATGSAFCPKIVGTYEKEIAHIVEIACAESYSTVVDIGAAEGYYAVGLALRMRQSQVVAFEQSERGRQLLRLLIRENSSVSDRIHIKDECTPALLTIALQSQGGTGRQLVICDVEGAEVELLDPIAIPELSKSDILVELHDCLRPRVRDTIRARFESTHKISHILSRARKASECPSIAHLRGREAIAAMWENRSAQAEWYWMRCNT